MMPEQSRMMPEQSRLMPHCRRATLPLVAATRMQRDRAEPLERIAEATLAVTPAKRAVAQVKLAALQLGAAEAPAALRAWLAQGDGPGYRVAVGCRAGAHLSGPSRSK
jgi:hypothetical protein